MDRYLKDRAETLKDIEDFIVLLFRFLKMVQELSKVSEEDDEELYTNYIRYTNFNALVKSLSLIHALYGYPSEEARESEGNGI